MAELIKVSAQSRSTAVAGAIATYMLFPLVMTLINGNADVCPSVERRYFFTWGLVSVAATLDAWIQSRR